MKLMSPRERQDAFDVALSVLTASFPKQVLGGHMHELWPDCETFLAHVLAFDKAVQQRQPSFLRQDAEMYVNMMCDVTWYLWEMGQYEAALKLLSSTEAICCQIIGQNSLEAARIFVNRGCVLSTLNRYQDAGRLFEKALHIRREQLPDNHQLLANSYMQMGNYYLNSWPGKTGIDNAIEAHKKVVEIRLRSSTTEPTVMINSYLNYSRSLMMGAILGEAESCLKKAEEVEDQFRDSCQTKVYLYYRHP
jgi:tetratricopeptide (TPR) repeat protein